MRQGCKLTPAGWVVCAAQNHAEEETIQHGLGARELLAGRCEHLIGWPVDAYSRAAVRPVLIGWQGHQLQLGTACLKSLSNSSLIPCPRSTLGPACTQGHHARPAPLQWHTRCRCRRGAGEAIMAVRLSHAGLMKLLKTCHARPPCQARVPQGRQPELPQWLAQGSNGLQEGVPVCRACRGVQAQRLTLLSAQQPSLLPAVCTASVFPGAEAPPAGGCAGLAPQTAGRGRPGDHARGQGANICKVRSMHVRRANVRESTSSRNQAAADCLCLSPWPACECPRWLPAAVCMAT